MTREHVLMALGALVLISPWSGISMAWLEWAFLVIGLAIIGIAFMVRKSASPAPLLPSPPAAQQPQSPKLPQAEEPRSRSSNIAFS